jgi:hypothetical protein
VGGVLAVVIADDRADSPARWDLRRRGAGGPLRCQHRDDSVRLASGTLRAAGSGGWLAFGFGCLAGAVPWLAIAIYLLSPGSASSASPPAFVHVIFLSLFVFFNIFALNQWLQYRARGRWSDYLFGERIYILLSLTAKSALAWQVFAGTLAS